MISRMQGLKRKLEGLHEEEQRWNKASKARVKHVQDLWDVQSLVDVKYDEWSRTRLSRLLVDYLLRSGYSESAAHLAQAKGIEELVDVEAFVQAHKIEKSLREGKSPTLALSWCKENGQALKKAGGGLEFELRLQQFIELVRSGHERMRRAEEGHGGGMEEEGSGEEKLVEARMHAKKWLSGTGDFEVLGRAAGLLAYRPWDPVEPYAVCLQLLTFQGDIGGLGRCGLLTIVIVSILGFSLGSPRPTLPNYVPQSLLTSSTTAPPYRPQRRSLRPQDTIMSFCIHLIIRQRKLLYNNRMPNLLDGAQRTSAECAICTPHEEYCGE